jgi:hypothetical protein
MGSMSLHAINTYVYFIFNEIDDDGDIGPYDDDGDLQVQ